MRFSGQVSTVKCFENNPLVRKALEEPGSGRVLVVDGGASKRCALLGVSDVCWPWHGHGRAACLGLVHCCGQLLAAQLTVGCWGHQQWQPTLELCCKGHLPLPGSQHRQRLHPPRPMPA
jgi:hypothetical protein